MTFEQTLAYYCSPTLLGLKGANLFSVSIEQVKPFVQEMKKYQGKFEENGIFIKVLYVCRKRIHVLVYRRQALQKMLSNPFVAQYLSEIGYPNLNHVEDALCYLQRRANRYSQFPHEIGFFLDYPVEDVLEFIQKKGQGYKFCGYWKVYTDEQRAKRLFYLYEQCKNKVLHQIAQGMSVLQLLPDAC